MGYADVAVGEWIEADSSIKSGGARNSVVLKFLERFVIINYIFIKSVT